MSNSDADITIEDICPTCDVTMILNADEHRVTCPICLRSSTCLYYPSADDAPPHDQSSALSDQEVDAEDDDQDLKSKEPITVQGLYHGLTGTLVVPLRFKKVVAGPVASNDDDVAAAVADSSATSLWMTLSTFAPRNMIQGTNMRDKCPFGVLSSDYVVLSHLEQRSAAMNWSYDDFFAAARSVLLNPSSS